MGGKTSTGKTKKRNVKKRPRPNQFGTKAERNQSNTRISQQRHGVPPPRKDLETFRDILRRYPSIPFNSDIEYHFWRHDRNRPPGNKRDKNRCPSDPPSTHHWKSGAVWPGWEEFLRSLKTMGTEEIDVAGIAQSQGATRMTRMQDAAESASGGKRGSRP